MIYNFRFDRNRRNLVLERLKEQSLLSQGWGGKRNDNLSLENDKDTFQERVKDYYDLRTTRIPTNLTKIRGFKDNDILVVPHLPEEKTFSIHIVDGNFPDCYRYLDDDEHHLKHTIKIKKSYGLEGNLSLYNSLIAPWKGKLQWMRLPILPMNQFKNEFHQLLSELRESPDKAYQKSDLEEYLDQLQKSILTFISQELGKISPSGGDINFESVCETILTNQGYEITNKNVYDGEGGDIDLICVKDRSNISPFEQGEETLFVQIKKHKGTTNKYGIDQLLNMMQNNRNANGCLITLAEEFTKEASTLAEENGIVLINGNTVSELLMSVMIDRI